MNGAYRPRRLSMGSSGWYNEVYKPHATSSSETEQLLLFGLPRIIREDSIKMWYLKWPVQMSRMLVVGSERKKEMGKEVHRNPGHIQRVEHGWFGPEHEKILEGKIRRIGLDKISRSFDF